MLYTEKGVEKEIQWHGILTNYIQLETAALPEYITAQIINMAGCELLLSQTPIK